VFEIFKSIQLSILKLADLSIQLSILKLGDLIPDHIKQFDDAFFLQHLRIPKCWKISILLSASKPEINRFHFGSSTLILREFCVQMLKRHFPDFQKKLQWSKCFRQRISNCFM